MPNRLKYLLDLRAAVANGKFDQKQLASLSIDDTDGRTVRLNDPDILAVLERRIAAEQEPAAAPADDPTAAPAVDEASPAPQDGDTIA